MSTRAQNVDSVWSAPLILATLALGGTTLVLGWRARSLGRRVKALESERASLDAGLAKRAKDADENAKRAHRERDDALYRAEVAEARWSAAWRIAPLATLDDAGRVVDVAPAAAHLRRPLGGRALATGDVDLGKGRLVRVQRAGDVALFTDLAPQARAEEEAAQIRALEETSFEGVALVRNDRIVECNAAFARLCGKLPHQVAGTPLRAWLAPELGASATLTRADGRALPVEALARATPGGTRVVHVREVLPGLGARP